jgi:hypothetical protein
VSDLGSSLGPISLTRTRGECYTPNLMADHLWRKTPDGAYIRPDGRVYESPGGKALGQRAMTDYQAARVVPYVPCESTRGEWGQRCPDCHRMLPNPKPIRSWMSDRHVGG